MRESTLVTNIRKAIERAYPEALVYKVAGGPYQEVGIPDLLACVHGVFIGIEVKHQKPGESVQHARERATPGQRLQIGRINAAGGLAGVATSIEEALDIIARGLTRNGQSERIRSHHPGTTYRG